MALGVGGERVGSLDRLLVLVGVVLHDDAEEVRPHTPSGVAKRVDAMEHRDLGVLRLRREVGAGGEHAAGESKARYARRALDSRGKCHAMWRSGGGAAAEIAREARSERRGAQGMGHRPTEERAALATT